MPPAVHVRSNDDVVAAILRGVESGIDEIGFDDLTVADLAERSGVSRATIYRRIGDRDTIFRTYIAHVSLPHIFETVNIARSPRPLAERMEEVLVRSATSWWEKPVLLRQLQIGNLGWLVLLADVLKTIRQDLATPLLFREAEALGWTLPAPEEELQHWLIERSCNLARNHQNDVEEVRRQVRTYVMPVLRLI